MADQEPASKIPATTWLWLLVVTYIIHIAEEYWGGEGYSAHLLKSKGVYMSPSRFLLVQAIGVGLMVAGVLIAKRFKFSNSMVVIMAAAITGNAITHIANAMRTFQYEPGLVSSIAIWIPFGLFSLIYFRHRVLNQRRFWTSIALGVAINVAIAVITMRGARL